MEKERIFPLLRRILSAIMSDRGYSSNDLTQARLLASKVYIMHTNREISLNDDEFNLIVQLLQFEHQLE